MKAGSELGPRKGPRPARRRAFAWGVDRLTGELHEVARQIAASITDDLDNRRLSIVEEANGREWVVYVRVELLEASRQ